MPRPKPKLTALERDFAQHLREQGSSPDTIERHITIARKFLKHTDSERIERISEEVTRAFFASLKSSRTRNIYASIVQRFLTFAASRLPVPITKPLTQNRAPVNGFSKDIALRQQWSVDKLIDQKQRADDLIAKLARKVIDHYLYFQGRMKGEPENLDDVYRFADECRELIESNLVLFMGLSAQGRNVHSVIDERIQPL